MAPHLMNGASLEFASPNGVYTNGREPDSLYLNGVKLNGAVTKDKPPVPIANSTVNSTPTDHLGTNLQKNAESKPWTSERCVDQARPLKVIYIGSGISGITGAIEFLKRVPEMELVLYEKNPEIGEIGGTWIENR